MFSSIDKRFSQVIGSSASNADINRPIVSSQDVTNPSFTAPSPVAVCYKHPPAWAPYAPYSDGLGKSREGPAAVRSPVGVSSLSKLAFSDLIDRVRVYEYTMDFVLDSYLDSLRSFVVYSYEFRMAIGGDSLEDSVRSFRQCLSDPHDPVPGTFQGGDNVIHFLFCLVASSGSSPQLALGAAGEHWGEGLDSSRVVEIPASSLASSVASPLRFLNFLRLIPPRFRLRSRSFSLLVSSLRLLFHILCLLPVLGLLLLLTLSPLPFPSLPFPSLPFPSLPPSIHLWHCSLCSFFFFFFSHFFDSVLCSIFGPSWLFCSSFGSCFLFFCCLFLFSSAIRFICLFVFYGRLVVASFCRLLLGSVFGLLVSSCSYWYLPSSSPPPSSVLFPPSVSFSSSSAPPLPTAVPSSGTPGVYPSSLFVPSGVSALASGVSAFDPPRDSFPFVSTSGVDFSDPCYFCDVDDSSTKGEKESPPLGKGDSS